MLKALKKKLRFLRQPAGRYWFFYVLGCSLLNLWAALLWGFTSWVPLETVWTDGSLIVFCFGAMWLTMADLGRELRRANPTGDSPVRDVQELFQGCAAFASLVAAICYTQFMVGQAGIEDWGRVVISASALLVGLVYAAQAISITHEVAGGHGKAA
jgi:hypothetical protein